MNGALACCMLLPANTAFYGKLTAYLKQNGFHFSGVTDVKAVDFVYILQLLPGLKVRVGSWGRGAQPPALSSAP